MKMYKMEMRAANDAKVGSLELEFNTHNTSHRAVRVMQEMVAKDVQ